MQPLLGLLQFSLINQGGDAVQFTALREGSAGRENHQAKSDAYQPQ
jgi:hypothetical protein